MEYEAFFASALQRLKTQGHYRVFAQIQRIVGDFPYAICHSENSKKKVVVWCSNDYLGMGQNEDVLHAMQETLADQGAGAGGTRNISGTSQWHYSLEKELADLHDKESSLIFTSGYVANDTCLTTLAKNLPDCVIFSDEKNHASMIEGIRHSGAKKHIFRHNDPEHLAQLLSQYPKEQAKLVAFESVYSMEGDISPIKELCDVADTYGAITYLDEVHGVGLYGHKGGGVAQQQGVSDRVTIIQGTFGKAIGLIGGYIASTTSIVDFVRSFAPGFIFTTALPPAIISGITTSIRVIKKGQNHRDEHQKKVKMLKEKLTAAKIPFFVSDSHIVPVIIGNADACRYAAQLLMDKYSIYVQPINYPTVPVGTERLRLAPTPFHNEEMIDNLVEGLKDVFHQILQRQAA
ncbi:MAG: 5-aminolevulinate synthase [Alphaproteobacteria bacterium]|nr:5-aminolevulinate synthase [Alphaproteobacteria bacterium]